jgi:hypothetical protein
MGKNILGIIKMIKGKGMAYIIIKTVHDMMVSLKKEKSMEME